MPILRNRIMSSELRTRILSGIIFVLIIIAGLYGSFITASLLMGVLGFLSLRELLTLLSLRNQPRLALTVLFLLAYIILIWSILMDWIGFNSLSNLFPFSTLLILFFMLFWTRHVFYLKKLKPNWINTLCSLLYLLIAFFSTAFISIFEASYQAKYLFGLFLFVWVNDTFAYFFGKRFGRTPLAPSISPKKTVEGWIGGIILTLLTGVLFSLVEKEHPSYFWWIFSLIVALTSPIGDLLESKLKRLSNKKDSGNIIPGHGGILDRLDGFIFAVPWVLIFLIKYTV